MYAMHAYGDNHFYKYSINKSHGYDLFYSKSENESFIYNINFNAYLTIELVKNNHKTIRIYSDLEGIVLKKGQVATIFDYYCFLSYEEGLESFKQSFPLQNHEKIFGYTSWYNYYQNINEEIIIRDLKALDNRFNLFQIDDGYETFVGDWLDVDKKKFPNGLKVCKFANGQIEKSFPDGTKNVNYADGTVRNVYSDGVEEIFFNDGSLQKVDKNGIITVTYTDGIQDTIFPDESKIRKYPDGRITKINPNGIVSEE
jgi:hypothetical protein